MRQSHVGPNDHGLPHGLSPGAVNFFMASGEGHLQRYIERMLCWGPGPHQPASTPVYGPSKTPRLQQFVDLTTNNGGMTPFFSLNSDAGGCVNNTVEYTEEEAVGREEEQMQVYMHPSQGQERWEDHMTMKNHVAQAHITMNTPQQKRQPVQISPGVNTPASTMGMTMSPATVSRSVIQVTPASTAARSTIHVENVSHPPPRNAHAVTMIGGSNSFATELESAFAEHTKRKNAVTKQNHREEAETSTCKADVDTTQSVADMSLDSKSQRALDTGRVDRSTQRRNKEKRHGKLHNGSQQIQQRQNNKTNANKTNTNHSVLKSHKSHETTLSMEDNRSCVVHLRCHGDRTATVFSCKQFHAGDHVIFDADRGVDLGEVLHCEELTNESSLTDAEADAAGGFGAKGGSRRSPPRVVRRATAEEVDDWRGALVTKEEEAVVECRAACEELKLTILIAGAAFQFDRQKLIFFYEADGRVDFRSLLQVMFSKFRCRIWMERINAPP
ncbi:hypothetical protein MOQ_001221 [Trypanosoma cruzi marinkellei]|uniref:PSP1 C-terminal domain-containing protein n=1 Tax=Trypanosoma cruzi marinkellei TaxID=85056 RepID=K2NGU1_TRYCR|nr:hypothetical protein MOQ_001221 [Trypanosoma cruzi marinkellei]